MLLLIVLLALLSLEALVLLLIFLERRETEGLVRAGDWQGERLS
jgi:hypothetical protein